LAVLYAREASVGTSLRVVSSITLMQGSSLSSGLTLQNTSTGSFTTTSFSRRLGVAPG